MDLKKILKSEFGEIIIDATIKNEFNAKVLEIITDTHNTDQLELISKKVNDYIDSLNLDIDTLYVISKGEPIDYEIEDLKNHIGQKCNFELHKSVNKLNKLIGEIISVNPNEISIKVNFKGQFRTIILDPNNIKKVSKYFNI